MRVTRMLVLLASSIVGLMAIAQMRSWAQDPTDGTPPFIPAEPVAPTLRAPLLPPMPRAPLSTVSPSGSGPHPLESFPPRQDAPSLYPDSQRPGTDLFPSAEAPSSVTNDPPFPADDAPSPAVEDLQMVEQLLQLRRRLGSPLKGTVLDDGDDDNFGALLRQAIREAGPAELPEGGDSNPWAAPETRMREPTMLPMPPPMNTVVSQQLRVSASALDSHAQELEQQHQPARAQRMRRLARRLRNEALEIDELSGTKPFAGRVH